MKMEATIETHKRMINMAAQDLVKRASRLGVVLTVAQVSTPPFSQGRYNTVVSVRSDVAQRAKAEKSAE
jgi:hypothetical protein